jgi:malate permease and related proteins
MANFLLIGVCIIAGMLFRRSKFLPADADKSINAWIIYLALPAVFFKYLPHIQWSKELLFPVIAPIVASLGGWLWIKLNSKRLSLDEPSAGGLTLITSLSNTSFLGFPMVMAYYGESEIGTAVICDQINFILFSTVGIVIAIQSSGKHILTAGGVIKKVVLFPPLIGCVAALTIPNFIDLSALSPLFDKLAATVAPLALFSIGLQLQFEGWQTELKTISTALLYKLIVAPLLIIVIAIVFQLKGKIVQVSIFEMAMPSLLSAALVANEYKLNPKLINLVVGVGIVLSFFTTAIWFYILKCLE